MSVAPTAVSDTAEVSTMVPAPESGSNQLIAPKPIINTKIGATMVARRLPALQVLVSKLLPSPITYYPYPSFTRLTKPLPYRPCEF